MIFALITFVLVMFLATYLLYLLVRLQDTRNSNEISQRREIIANLDRIGSILREDQATNKQKYAAEARLANSIKRV